MSIRWATIGVVAVALLAGCGGERPGSSAVYDRISATTDCDALQREFDTASASHDRATTDDQREITLSYMQAADDRMKEVNCY